MYKIHDHGHAGFGFVSFEELFFAGFVVMRTKSDNWLRNALHFLLNCVHEECVEGSGRGNRLVAAPLPPPSPVHVCPPEPTVVAVVAEQRLEKALSAADEVFEGLIP